MGVVGDVGQRFAHDRHEVVGDVDVHRLDGAVELQAGLEPEPVGGLGDHLEQAPPQPTRRRRRPLEGEHRHPQLFDRLIETIDGRLEPGPGPLRITDTGHRGLQAQALGEQPLDHGVVQVAGDPFPVLGHGQHLFGVAQRVLAVAQLRFGGQAGRDVAGQGDHRAAAIAAAGRRMQRLLDGYFRAVLRQQDRPP